MITTSTPAADTVTLAAMTPGPGMQLPVNAYCLRGSQPTLIDAGLSPMSAEFQTALWNLVDPADLCWIVITHDDRDHIGSLQAILDAAPHATVVTNFTSMIRLAEDWQLPLDRLRLVNPGDRLDIGDDVLEAFRPPTYDSPGTLAFHALNRNVCFSSDCLGAFLPLTVEAGMAAEDVSAADYQTGTATFASALSPWLHDLSGERWNDALTSLRGRNIGTLLSTHGLPVSAGLDRLLDSFAGSAAGAPYVPPAQDAVDILLAMTATDG